MLSKSPSELESNLVRTDPVDTKSIVLKSVNGIIDSLKKYELVPKKSVVLSGTDDRWSGGNAAMDNNSLSFDEESMRSIEEKIEDLNYLIAPITNGEVRNEINKIIEIFKFDPQLASIQDVHEYINLYGFDNLDGGVARNLYGGHDNIDGNQKTLRLRRDSAYNWQYLNPILMDQEHALELDTMKYKIGDGVSHFNDLPYRDKSLVLQEMGNSLIDVMSQKAITRELNYLHSVYNVLKSTND